MPSPHNYGAESNHADGGLSKLRSPHLLRRSNRGFMFLNPEMFFTVD
jgi:hypothetical protein